MKDIIDKIFDQVMDEVCDDPVRRFAELIREDERQKLAPPSKPWVSLTDEERYLNDVRTEKEIEYAYAIEAKLKEKNT